MSYILVSFALEFLLPGMNTGCWSHSSHQGTQRPSGGNAKINANLESESLSYRTCASSCLLTSSCQDSLQFVLLVSLTPSSRYKRKAVTARAAALVKSPFGVLSDYTLPLYGHSRDCSEGSAARKEQAVL